MQTRSHSRRARLRLQRLEDRAVPTIIPVTNADDAGPGSLRQAILDANATGGPDDIAFDANFFSPTTPRTITLLAASGQLNVTDDLTIAGPGPAVLTVSGGGVTRVFNVDDGQTGAIAVTISGLTVTGGNSANGTPNAGDGGGLRTTNETITLDTVAVTGNSAGQNDGGGIAVTATSNYTVRNCTISGNTGRRGGGIYFSSGGSLIIESSTLSGNISTTVGTNGGGGLYFFGVVGAGGFVIRNSTIAGNTTAGSGGGLVLRQLNGTLQLQNSTITGNTANTTGTGAGYGGGGIALALGNANSALAIESSIVSGNTATAANGRSDIVAVAAAPVTVNFSAVGDPDGFAFTGGNNLAFGTVLALLPLGNYGGPTQTIALDLGSPAISAGSNPAGLTTDQRGAGFARPFGGATDIGAFEFQGSPRVLGVAVNPGQTNVVQRSRVTALAVTFSTQVTFAGNVADAFGLSRIGGAAVGGFTATANVVNNVTVVTLAGFTGAETEFGSLADGRYRLVVRADQVTGGGQPLDGDGNGTGGDDFALDGTTANGLFRFYGDVSGDGTVNAFDFGQFRPAFGSTTGQLAYRDFLDFNADGAINAFDFGQFRPRFGATVP